MRFYEPQMLEHRMAGKLSEPAGDAQHHWFWIDALKLALAEIGFDAVELAEEIVIPERAPEFPVSDGLKADPPVSL